MVTTKVHIDLFFFNFYNVQITAYSHTSVGINTDDGTVMICPVIPV